MKKRIFFLIVLFCFVFSIYGKAKNNEISIFVPKTLSSIPVMELDKKTINNYTIKVEFFNDHITTMAEFVSGKIQVLMTGFSQGLAFYQSSNDIVMVSTSVWGVSSLVTNDPALTKLSDFTGKTILVPFAKSPLELQLKAILKKEGLLDKVKIDYAVIQQQIPLLLTKKTDGICIPEPLVSTLVNGKKAFEVFSFAKKWGEVNNGESRSPQVSIFVKKDFAKNNKVFLNLLIKLIKENIVIVKSKPDLISKKYAPTFNIEPSIIESGLKNVVFDIPDYQTEIKICKDYQQSIDDPNEINDDFFFNYK